MFQRWPKRDPVKHVVDDDEDDEYEQYHGFNMRM